MNNTQIITTGIVILLCNPAFAQFTSGSDGSDGALNIAGGQGTIVFDKTALGIDADGDNIYHFTTITVGAGTTVTLRAGQPGLSEGVPLIWLATGAVNIAGTLDLNGAQGHLNTDPAAPSAPGAGGFAGGAGGTAGGDPPRGGAGPGGGSSQAGREGGNASHLTLGSVGSPTTRAMRGQTYGNRFLLPLIGGSGGAGGADFNGGNGAGGGAGGGAILVATSGDLELSGMISVRGGEPGLRSGQGRFGGTGSGGAVRLMANAITGGGTIDVRDFQSGALGGVGRIRLESFNTSQNLTLNPPTSASFVSPGFVLAPTSAPTVRITTIAGVNVPQTPSGSFVMPDVAFANAAAVTINIAATNIPVGTQVTLRLVSEEGVSMTITSNALAGTLAASTADTAPVSFPSGFTKVFVHATW